MFSLFKVNIVKRSIITLACAAFLVLGITLAIKSIEFFHVNAITSNGDEVSVTYGDDIYYGYSEFYEEGYRTNRFIVSSGGNRFTSFCANPGKVNPDQGETFNAVDITNTTDADIVKLIIYIATTTNNETTSNLMHTYYDPLLAMDSDENPSSAEDRRYAYAHATIGLIYGDSQGLTEAMVDKIDDVIDDLNSKVDNSNDVWLMAKNYKLFQTDVDDDSDIQSVVWIENNDQYGDIKVHKCDKEIESTCSTSASRHSTQGRGSLAGITFTLYNASGSRIYNPANGNFYNNGAAMGTATTNDNGIATFSRLPTGVKYSVKETATNSSYLLSDTGTKTVNSLTMNGAAVAFSDYIKRGDVKFTKVDENGSPMTNAAFTIVSKTTGESHVVVADSNGVVNTANSFIQHSVNTNGYDSITDGNYVHQNYGTWFYGAKTGTMAPVDNGLGALPYDNYTLTELECDANKYCYDVASVSRNFNVTEGSQVIDLGDISNDCAEFSIATTATDTADGDKFIEASATASITDTIGYCGKAGLTYTVQGVLMDKETNQPIAEQTITDDLANDCGTATMAFSLDASELAGKDIVAFETLMYEDEIVAEHKDIDDASQTVTVINLSTTAVDGADGDKLVEASTNSQIIDSIDYCLRSDLEYTIKGILMDKETDEPLAIDGKTIEETISFTPTDGNCGTAQMTFTLDSTKLAGKAIVVYESVEYNGETILTHQDIEDVAQTVNIISLDTYALDRTDRDKEVIANKEATVTDHIKYCLVANTNYTIVGTLMNKATGKAIMVDDAPVWSTTTITPTENCGDLYLDFDFDATGLGGTEIVVYEAAGITSPTPLSDSDICLEHDTKDPNACTSYFHTLITHTDLNDVAQTVLVANPPEVPETGSFAKSSSSNNTDPVIFPVALTAISAIGYSVFRFISRKKLRLFRH